MSVPTKWAIAQYWADAFGHEVFAPHLEDLAHPCCFACGWFSERWYKETPKASWERAKLERAHIIPSGLGGRDGAADIILLCNPCHVESPDWFDPWEMALWISSRPERPSKEVEDAETWIRAMAEVPEFTKTMESFAAKGDSGEGVVSLLRESARHAVVHGAVSLSQATMAAIVRHAVKEAGRAA
jgi:hypothetical protein